MGFQVAQYHKLNSPILSGNPLIECLPIRLSQEAFWDAVVDLVEVPEQLDSFDVETRELLASEIMKSVCPTSEYFDIYCDLLNTLKEGFISRNPLDSNTEKWKNNIATKTYQRTRTTAPNIKFTGISGMGKTTVVDSILALIPPVLTHPHDGPLGVETTHINYIKVNIPGEADSKSICLAIASKIDAVYGTDYETQYGALKRSVCIDKIITLCTTLLIGMIIFDEIHNICFSSPNERALIFTLFDRFSHEARIPTIKIGTFKANRLSNKVFTNARRLGMPVDWANFSAESEDWKMLVEYAWSYQLTNEYQELTQELAQRVYEYTCGVPHCLFFLIEQANKYCLRNGIDKFSKEVLATVFNLKFSIMKPAILALKHGKIDAFDDLMTTNSDLDVETTKLIKKLLKIADENKFTGQESKAIIEQIEPYMMEYSFTKKELATFKRLEKQVASIPSNLPKEDDGYEDLPI